MSREYKVQVFNKDIPTESDLSFKIIIIGDSYVGKSCLALRATKGVFDSVYTPTIGFEFLTFFLKLDDKNIKMQIWDTCGQEVYRSLIGSFYRNSSLAIIVYSIDNYNSFTNIETWLNELKSNCNPDINIFLIGNKADLEEQRVVSKEVANELCEKHNIHFFLETSAKTGFNAENVFIEAAKVMYEQHMKFKDRMSRADSYSEMLNGGNKMESNNIQSLEVEENYNSQKNKKSGCCPL